MSKFALRFNLLAFSLAVAGMVAGFGIAVCDLAVVLAGDGTLALILIVAVFGPVAAAVAAARKLVEAKAFSLILYFAVFLAEGMLFMPLFLTRTAKWPWAIAEAAFIVVVAAAGATAGHLLSKSPPSAEPPPGDRASTDAYTEQKS